MSLLKTKFFRRTLRTVVAIFLFLNFMVAMHALRLTYHYEANELAYLKPENMTTFQKAMTIFTGFKIPKRTIDAFPDAPFSDVRLQNEVGQMLAGWLAPSSDTTVAARGTVIVWHGHGSSKAAKLPEIAAFRSLGFRVVAFDFRAHGASQGNVCTIGIRESSDVRRVFGYVRDSLKEKNIVLYGMSLGASTILKAMAEDSTLKPQRLILECPFASLRHATAGRLRLLNIPAAPWSDALMCWASILRGINAYEMQPQAFAKSITPNTPTLLNWGQNDPRVTRIETDTIFAHLASRDKKLTIFENSAHQSYCAQEPEKWLALMTLFLK